MRALLGWSRIFKRVGGKMLGVGLWVGVREERGRVASLWMVWRGEKEAMRKPAGRFSRGWRGWAGRQAEGRAEREEGEASVDAVGAGQTSRRAEAESQEVWLGLLTPMRWRVEGRWAARRGGGGGGCGGLEEGQGKGRASPGVIRSCLFTNKPEMKDVQNLKTAR